MWTLHKTCTDRETCIRLHCWMMGTSARCCEIRLHMPKMRKNAGGSNCWCIHNKKEPPMLVRKKTLLLKMFIQIMTPIQMLILEHNNAITANVQTCSAVYQKYKTLASLSPRPLSAPRPIKSTNSHHQEVPNKYYSSPRRARLPPR